LRLLRSGRAPRISPDDSGLTAIANDRRSRVGFSRKTFLKENFHVR
jgi:hypothetical protein